MATPTLITVTGKHTKRDGVTPETGTVVFQAPGFVRSSADKQVISPGKTTAVLDSTGAYSFAVFACTDPVWNSVNWSYTVIVNLSEHRETFDFSIPYDQPGGTIDMAEMAPEPPAGGINYALVNHTHAGGGGGGSTAWTDITGKPSTFPPSVHSHAQSDITGLSTALGLKADTSTMNTALAGKAATVHTHAQSDVTGLTTALGLKADASAVTTALGNKADLVGGVIPTAQIPAIAITEYLGAAANQTAMLALAGQVGDWAVRTDLATTWVITGADPTQLASWTQLSYPTAPVTSVAGRTGVVTLTSTDVGLGNVTNTSDANKPVSTAQQTALNLKANLASPAFTGTVSGITAAMVGLPNVNNTADSAKPVSTAQQTALDGKPDVYVWNGTSYALVTTGDFYMGPSTQDPGAVGNGSVWIKTS
jgi:hypothetical protein